MIAAGCQGDPSVVVKSMTTVLLHGFLSSQFPPSLQLLFYFNVYFWSIADCVVTQLDDSGCDSAEQCYDFASRTDGRVVALAFWICPNFESAWTG